MNASVLAALCWLLAANLLAMLPSRNHHRRRAYLLIACGLPILVWLGWQTGIWAALLFLLAGMSVLRWPVRYLVAWIGRLARRGP